MKIYISGKITGLSIKEATSNFDKAETLLVGLGHQVVNPMKLVPYSPNLSWLDYMRADIKALVDCDGIFLLPDWSRSNGAILEHQIAKGLRMPAFEYQPFAPVEAYRYMSKYVSAGYTVRMVDNVSVFDRTVSTYGDDHCTPYLWRCQDVMPATEEQYRAYINSLK